MPLGLGSKWQLLFCALRVCSNWHCLKPAVTFSSSCPGDASMFLTLTKFGINSMITLEKVEKWHGDEWKMLEIEESPGMDLFLGCPPADLSKYLCLKEALPNFKPSFYLPPGFYMSTTGTIHHELWLILLKSMIKLWLFLLPYPHQSIITVFPYLTICEMFSCSFTVLISTPFFTISNSLFLFSLSLYILAIWSHSQPRRHTFSGLKYKTLFPPMI